MMTTFNGGYYMTRRAFAFSAILAASLALPGAVFAEGDARPEAAHGLLDGLVFVSTIEVLGTDRQFPDRKTFSDGMFFSEECQRACDFGAHAYYTRAEGDSTAFVVDMACSDAPQSVRWEGRVTGDRIEGTAHWKVERLYWTVERHATFEGMVVKGPDRQAAILTE